MTNIKKTSKDEFINILPSLFLIIRKCDNNYYIADETYELANNKTPTESLVCEITKTKEEVTKDIVTMHSLPKKLPNYIIEGLRNRLAKEITNSLLKEFKSFEDEEGSFLGDKEIIETMTINYINANKMLIKLVNSFSDINDFFKFAMLIQKNKTMNIYLLDLFDKK